MMGDSGQWLHHLAVPQKIYRSKIMAVTIADIIAGLPVARQKKIARQSTKLVAGMVARG